VSGPALHDEVRDDSAASRRGTAPHLLVGLADGLLDCAVVLLASWTVVYHASLLLGLRSTPALLVEAAVLVLGAAAWAAVTRSRPRPSPDLTRPHPAGASLRWDRTVLVTVVAAAVGALAMALDVPWILVWPAWLVAGVAGTACALTRLRIAGPERAPVSGLSALESWVVIVCTLGLAAFSMVVLRPNPDDLFYVNWSQWVAAHGEFPLRDTLYSDLGYPLANWPPVASYDGLVGAVAHLLGTSAGNVVYIVVPPVATGLAVLALWRLLRAWGVEHRVVALLAALAFLLVDGTESYASPGNLFATRLWQGKVILACVLVPVLLVHLLRQAERPSRSRLGFLFLCGTAAVALSTTAIFLVPVVAAAGAAPLVRTSRRAALAAFAAAAAYPVGAGIVTLALGGRSADDFGIRRQYRFDPSWFGHQVFLTGPMALLAVGAVLLGALLVPHPAARVTTGVAVVLVGLTFVPGFTRLTYDVVGLGPTLWRLTWACTVAALVGAGASWVAGRLRRSRRAAVAAGLAGVLLLAGFGSPIWAEDTTTTFASPPHWQRGPSSRAAAAWLVRQATPPGTVLAPDGLSTTVVVTQTGVKVVAPRDYYLDYLSDNPDFLYEERLLLSRFANADPTAATPEVAPALDRLDVRAACLYRRDHTGAHVLLAAGYHRGFLSGTYRCFRR
jgi:hypothetical protein